MKGKRSNRMSPSERRQVELTLLCHRRFDTIINLSHELGVSRSTVSHDITILMCSYPIETIRGGGGGIKVADNFYLHHKTLNAEQIELLLQLQPQFSGKALDTLNSILFQFTL